MPDNKSNEGTTDVDREGKGVVKIRTKKSDLTEEIVGASDDQTENGKGLIKIKVVPETEDSADEASSVSEDAAKGLIKMVRFASDKQHL